MSKSNETASLVAFNRSMRLQSPSPRLQPPALRLQSPSLRSMRSIRCALESEVSAGRRAEEEAWASMHKHQAVVEEAQLLSLERQQLEDEVQSVRMEEERIWRERSRQSKAREFARVRSAEEQWLEYRQQKQQQFLREVGSIRDTTSVPPHGVAPACEPQQKLHIARPLTAERASSNSVGSLQATLNRREALFAQLRRKERRGQSLTGAIHTSSRPSTASPRHHSDRQPLMSPPQSAACHSFGGGSMRAPATREVALLHRSLNDGLSLASADIGCSSMPCRPSTAASFRQAERLPHKGRPRTADCSLACSGSSLLARPQKAREEVEQLSSERVQDPTQSSRFSASRPSCARSAAVAASLPGEQTTPTQEEMSKLRSTFPGLDWDLLAG